MGKKKKAVAPRPLTKKQRSRAEREARAVRWIIISAAVVGTLVVAVLVYGYLSEVVLRAREPVASVSGVPISTADFETRVRYERTLLSMILSNRRAEQSFLDPTDPAAASLLQQLNLEIRQLEEQLSRDNALTLGEQALEQMVREEIIRQEAARLGLAVSPEEVDRAVEEWFGYRPDEQTAGPDLPFAGPVTATQPTTPTDSAARDDFEQRYQNFITSVLEPSGMDRDTFRAMMEADLLYKKVYAFIVDKAPTVADQVQINYIAFQLEEEAAAALERLEAGEDWDDIVAELQESEAVDAFSGELGWQTVNTVIEQFGIESARVVFDTPVGAYTAPLPGLGGWYYVLHVMGHEEREMDAETLTYEQERVFQEWLNLQRQYVVYSENWREKVPTEP